MSNDLLNSLSPSGGQSAGSQAQFGLLLQLLQRIASSVEGASPRYGTGQIASGNTFVVITHNLGVIPAWYSVQPTNQTTNAPGLISIGTVTTTQMTVTCKSDPGASNLNFNWQVSL